MYKIFALAIFDPPEEGKNMVYLLELYDLKELERFESTMPGILQERPSPKTIAKQNKMLKTPPSTSLVWVGVLIIKEDCQHVSEGGDREGIMLHKSASQCRI